MKIVLLLLLSSSSFASGSCRDLVASRMTSLAKAFVSTQLGSATADGFIKQELQKLIDLDPANAQLFQAAVAEEMKLGKVTLKTEREKSKRKNENLSQIDFIFSGKLEREFNHDDQKVRSIVFSEDQKKILTTTSSEHAWLWDLESTQPIFKKNVQWNVRFGVFGDDSHSAVLVTPSGQYFNLDFLTGDFKRIEDFPSDSTLHSAPFSPDHRYQVAFLNRSLETLQIVDRKLNQRFQLSVGHFISKWSFSRDSARIAVVTGSGNWKVVDLNSQNDIRSLRQDQGVLDITFDQSGHEVVTSGNEETKIRSLISGEELNLEAVGGSESSFFSDDGKYIVAIQNGNVRVVERSSLKLVAEVAAPKIITAALSKDNSALLISVPGSVQLWKIRGKLKELVGP